ncbi:MAG: hypothetical protein U9Q06_02940 [Nanoarchaeota archaeon]|nr:hypothetical protein [Nanoarchaeota archaeon]
MWRRRLKIKLLKEFKYTSRLEHKLGVIEREDQGIIYHRSNLTKEQIRELISLDIRQRNLSANAYTITLQRKNEHHTVSHYTPFIQGSFS